MKAKEMMMLQCSWYKRTEEKLLWRKLEKETFCFSGSWSLSFFLSVVIAMYQVLTLGWLLLAISLCLTPAT